MKNCINPPPPVLFFNIKRTEKLTLKVLIHKYALFLDFTVHSIVSVTQILSLIEEKFFFEIFLLIVINCYICIAANEKICSRCSERFSVNPDGTYVLNPDGTDVCVFLPLGKRIDEKKRYYHVSLRAYVKHKRSRNQKVIIIFMLALNLFQMLDTLKGRIVHVVGEMSKKKNAQMLR